MRVSEDKEKYMKYYLDSLCFSGELRIGAIKRMAEYKGEGAEYISSSFDPDDEDYKNGYVTLFFWAPADDEDTMVFVENSMFYERLLEVCNAHVLKSANDKELLNGYLNQIKKDLEL